MKTRDVTASSPADYTAVTRFLQFAVGEQVKFVQVTIKTDSLNEPNETFHVVLSAAVEATIGDGIGVVTIFEDD